jgi:hypothetical protein
MASISAETRTVIFGTTSPDLEVSGIGSRAVALRKSARTASSCQLIAVRSLNFPHQPFSSHGAVQADLHVAREKLPRSFPGVDGRLLCKTIVFIAAVITDVNSGHTLLLLSASTLVFA